MHTETMSLFSLTERGCRSQYRKVLKEFLRGGTSPEEARRMADEVCAADHMMRRVSDFDPYDRVEGYGAPRVLEMVEDGTFIPVFMRYCYACIEETEKKQRGEEYNNVVVVEGLELGMVEWADPEVCCDRLIEALA